jgi:hypothetical protein
VSNMPNEETKQLPLADQLNALGVEHGISRNDGECDEAYAERMIDSIDTKVENLWAVQDDICVLLIANGIE